MNRRFFFQLVVSALLGKYCPSSWRPSIAEMVRQRMERAYLKMHAQLAAEMYLNGFARPLNGRHEFVDYGGEYMGLSRVL